MKLLTWQEGEQKETCNFLLIFGLGLIGKDILLAARRVFSPKEMDFPMSWSERDVQTDNLEQIFYKLAKNVEESTALNKQCAVIWAAGSAGFGAAKHELQREYESFLGVLELCKKVERNLTFEHVEFHLMSSAGGLFEGQTLVDLNTSPMPKRPYGVSKLEQELAAKSLSELMNIRIYRPSTVFGFHPGQGRQGVVTTLIRNSIKLNTTEIFGKPATLRDYVSSSDIGKYLAKMLFRKSGQAVQTMFLVSGKPSSLTEIVSLVETAVNKTAFLHYCFDTENALNNTFRPECMPPGWQPAPIGLAIKLTSDAYIKASLSEK